MTGVQACSAIGETESEQRWVSSGITGGGAFDTVETARDPITLEEIAS